MATPQYGATQAHGEGDQRSWCCPEGEDHPEGYDWNRRCQSTACPQTHLQGPTDRRGGWVGRRAVQYRGRSYKTVSAAGGAAKAHVNGSPVDDPLPATNSWCFWKYKDPETGGLRFIDDLRRQHVDALQ